MKSMVGQISGKGIGYALVAMFALAAAQSAKAEWWGFKGSATSPSYWNEKKNWYISGGDWNNFETATLQNVHINPHPAAADIFVSGWDKVITFQANSTLNAAMLKFCAGSVSDPIVFVAEDPGCGITCSGYFQGLASDNAPAPCLEIRSGTYRFTYLDIGTTSGKTNTVVVNGGTLKTTSSYARIGNVGCGVLTVKAGSFDNLESGNKNLTLGQASGSSGTLNIAGGTAVIGGYIALNYASGANKSAINITDGGVLTVNNIYLRYAGASGGTIMVDGGTLRAYANNATFLPAFSDAAKFHVYAGANGATIDAKY